MQSNIYIASDKYLLNADLLCLTETQLAPDQNIANTKETLHQVCHSSQQMYGRISESFSLF